MIAQRGRLLRRPRIPVVPEKGENDGAEAGVAKEEAYDWVWTGEWAFGGSVDAATSALLPFQYHWQHAATEGITKEEEEGASAGIKTKETPVDAPFPTPLNLNSKEEEEKACESAFQLPPSGMWKGSFDTLVGRKISNQKCVTIQEEFLLTWENSNPPPNGPPPDTTASSSHSSALVPSSTATTDPNKIHVMGRGENQYGSFEFVGWFHRETNVLQCQKRYIFVSTEEDNDTTGAPTGGAVEPPSTGDRPYQTRRRQMSWKRRAAYDNDPPSVPPHHSPKKRSRSESHPTAEAPPLKRSFSTMEPTCSSWNVSAKATTLLSSNTATGDTAVLRQRSQSLSIVTSPPNKMTSGMMSSSSSSFGANGGNHHPPTTTTQSSAHPSVWKLPLAGEPHQARWRAAHFLYYLLLTAGDEAPDESTAPHAVVYEGDLLHAHRHGRGVAWYSTVNLLYEGDWKRDKEHGYGKLMTGDRQQLIYSGEWERGRMHGTGTYYYSPYAPAAAVESRIDALSEDAPPKIISHYQGEFKENLRHGTGTYVLPDGSVYTGQWRENLLFGRGTFTWPDGSTYDGEWKDGKRHGLGLLKTSDGFMYDGSWVLNCMEGRGSATYPNGQQYHGLFSRGRREGRGTILFTNGAVYEGRFRDDAIDGQGTMKMTRTMIVPTAATEDEDVVDSTATEGTKKNDFMIPVSFQSDMGHIHRKAGFTHGGK